MYELMCKNAHSCQKMLINVHFCIDEQKLTSPSYTIFPRAQELNAIFTFRLLRDIFFCGKEFTM